MAGAIVQYISGNTSYLDDEAQSLCIAISDAREEKQDFIRLYAKGKQVWIDPNKVEAIFAFEPTP